MAAAARLTVLAPVNAIGRLTLGLMNLTGSVVLFALRGVTASLSLPWYGGQFLRQCMSIGFRPRTC